MATTFQVEVYWFVTPCSVVVGYSVSEVHATIFKITSLRPEDGGNMDL